MSLGLEIVDFKMFNRIDMLFFIYKTDLEKVLSKPLYKNFRDEVDEFIERVRKGDLKDDEGKGLQEMATLSLDFLKDNNMNTPYVEIFKYALLIHFGIISSNDPNIKFESINDVLKLKELSKLVKLPLKELRQSGGGNTANKGLMMGYDDDDDSKSESESDNESREIIEHPDSTAVEHYDGTGRSSGVSLTVKRIFTFGLITVTGFIGYISFNHTRDLAIQAAVSNIEGFVGNFQQSVADFTKEVAGEDFNPNNLILYMNEYPDENPVWISAERDARKLYELNVRNMVNNGENPMPQLGAPLGPTAQPAATPAATQEPSAGAGGPPPTAFTPTASPTPPPPPPKLPPPNPQPELKKLYTIGVRVATDNKPKKRDQYEYDPVGSAMDVRLNKQEVKDKKVVVSEEDGEIKLTGKPDIEGAVTTIEGFDDMIRINWYDESTTKNGKEVIGEITYGKIVFPNGYDKSSEFRSSFSSSYIPADIETKPYIIKIPVDDKIGEAAVEEVLEEAEEAEEAKIEAEIEAEAAAEIKAEVAAKEAEEVAARDIIEQLKGKPLKIKNVTLTPMEVANYELLRPFYDETITATSGNLRKKIERLQEKGYKINFFELLTGEIPEDLGMEISTLYVNLLEDIRTIFFASAYEVRIKVLSSIGESNNIRKGEIWNEEKKKIRRIKWVI